MSNRLEKQYLMNKEFDGVSIDETAISILEKDVSFIKENNQLFESFVHGLRLSRKLLEGYISVISENALTLDQYEIISKRIIQESVNELLSEYDDRYCFVIHTVVNMLTLSKQLSEVVGKENLLIDNTEIEILKNLELIDSSLVSSYLPPILEVSINEEVINTKCIKISNFKPSIKDFAIAFTKDYIQECINATERSKVHEQFANLNDDNIIKMPGLFIPGQNN